MVYISELFYEYELPIEIMIINNFLSTLDLIKLAKTNKNLYRLAHTYISKNIKNLYEVLQKCQSFILPDSCSFYHSNFSPYSSSPIYYESDYWYNLFGRNLNSEELAVYYAYFVKIYKYESRQYSGQYGGEEDWRCLISPDGFIRCFAFRGGNLPELTNDEQELQITNYYREGNYYNSDIKFLNFRYIQHEQIHIPVEINLVKINKNLFEKIMLSFINYNEDIQNMEKQTFGDFFNSF